MNKTAQQLLPELLQFPCVERRSDVQRACKLRLGLHPKRASSSISFRKLFIQLGPPGCICLESEEAEPMGGQNICGAASPGSFLNTKLNLEPQA